MGKGFKLYGSFCEDYYTCDRHITDECSACKARAELKTRIETINDLLRDAEELAAKHELVVGLSKNAVGQLDFEDPGDSIYRDMGWTESHICR